MPGGTRALVWIDLSNSPHPLLFAPVAQALTERGYEVAITARDNAQTVTLARQRWDDVAVIGGESPPGRVAKARAIAGRIGELARWARARNPAVALSHNSYAQIAAARLARVPAVTAMDYEHQPANHLGFRLARRVLLPDAFPDSDARRQGASPGKVVRYPGLKEALYVGDFEPQSEPVPGLTITEREGPLVVARTPPARALYHRLENSVFGRALEVLGERKDVTCVVVPRHPEQRAALEGMRSANVHIPAEAVDTRSLMHAADLVIGAGGTMTREAALLGVPTLTAFAGEVPAVDLALEREGKLQRLTDPEALRGIERRASPPRSIEELRALGKPVLERFVAAVEEAAER